MQKFKDYLYALINSLMIISGSVILGLNIRLLYYFNIPKIQAMNEEYSGGLIRSNYDILIDYLNPFYLIYFRQRKERELGYMKKAAILTFIIPVILGIPFIVDFSRAFVIFHEIAFSNDYWIFDPRIDPVIKNLPEWFFMYAAFLILILMLLFAVLFYTIGSRSMKKNKK